MKSKSQLRLVQSKALLVNPLRKSNFNTPKRYQSAPGHEVDDIIKKYLGSDVIDDDTTSRSITTMFHYVQDEPKLAQASPIKHLTELDCNNLVEVYQKVIGDQDDEMELFHLKSVNQDISIHNDEDHSLEQVSENLNQIFLQHSIDKSPEFYNPTVNPQLNHLPIIEEFEENSTERATEDRLSSLLTKIDETIQKQENQKIMTSSTTFQDNQSETINRIKMKYEPKIVKEDEFFDFTTTVPYPITLQPPTERMANKITPEVKQAESKQGDKSIRLLIKIMIGVLSMLILVDGFKLIFG